MFLVKIRPAGSDIFLTASAINKFKKKKSLVDHDDAQKNHRILDIF